MGLTENGVFLIKIRNLEAATEDRSNISEVRHSLFQTATNISLLSPRDSTRETFVVDTLEALIGPDSVSIMDQLGISVSYRSFTDGDEIPQYVRGKKAVVLRFSDESQQTTIAMPINPLVSNGSLPLTTRTFLKRAQYEPASQDIIDAILPPSSSFESVSAIGVISLLAPKSVDIKDATEESNERRSVQAVSALETAITLASQSVNPEGSPLERMSYLVNELRGMAIQSVGTVSSLEKFNHGVRQAALLVRLLSMKKMLLSMGITISRIDKQNDRVSFIFQGKKLLLFTPTFITSRITAFQAESVVQAIQTTPRLQDTIYSSLQSIADGSARDSVLALRKVFSLWYVLEREPDPQAALRIVETEANIGRQKSGVRIVIDYASLGSDPIRVETFFPYQVRKFVNVPSEILTKLENERKMG